MKIEEFTQAVNADVVPQLTDFNKLVPAYIMSIGIEN